MIMRIVCYLYNVSLNNVIIWMDLVFQDISLDDFVHHIDQVIPDMEEVGLDMGTKLLLAHIPFVGDKKKHLQESLDCMVAVALDIPVLGVDQEIVVDLRVFAVGYNLIVLVEGSSLHSV